MATISVLNLSDSSAIAVTNFPIQDKTDYVLVDTVSVEGKREATFQKVAGDQEFPLSIRIGHYPTAKANNGIGQTNISIKLSTYVQKVDGTEVVYTLPFTATLALSAPGMSGIPDNDDVKAAIAALFSFVLPVVAGAVSTTALDELKYGVVGNLLTHVDSAA